MTTKDMITLCCKQYAKKVPKSVFLGYNVGKGSRMYGTLEDVPLEQCIETPVAENLMMGLAMGMSLEGYRPVVCFERHDFILLALDAISNHLDKMPTCSGWQYSFPVVIRAIVGGKGPLDAGVQHTQDYSYVLKKICRYVRIYDPAAGWGHYRAWKRIISTKEPAIIIERRDDYEKEVNVSVQYLQFEERIDHAKRIGRTNSVELDISDVTPSVNRGAKCYAGEERGAGEEDGASDTGGTLPVVQGQPDSSGELE